MLHMAIAWDVMRCTFMLTEIKFKNLKPQFKVKLVAHTNQSQ